jgi:hypothetical protein
MADEIVADDVEEALWHSAFVMLELGRFFECNLIWLQGVVEPGPVAHSTREFKRLRRCVSPA